MKELHKNASKFKYVLPGGETIPGVTTVLKTLAKPALLNWANNMGLKGKTIYQGSEKATDIGSIAHYLIDCTIKDIGPVLEGFEEDRVKKARELHDSFWALAKEKNFSVKQSELSLCDSVNKYGGTLDLLGLEGDKGALWDIKTSKAIYVDYYIQVSAYKLLCECNALGPLHPRIVLLTKDGRVYAPDISDSTIQHATSAWWGLLATHKALKQLEFTL